MLDTNYERAPESDSPSPVGEQCNVRNVSAIKEMPTFEDSMGGLEGVFSAEQQGAVSINKMKHTEWLQGERSKGQ
jgi:hypothetical protein